MSDVLMSDFERFVAKRCKPGVDIDMSAGSDKHLVHMLLGLAGEVGELVDACKKYLIYDQPLDIEHVLEELGDVEFYLAGLRNGLYAKGGATRSEILAKNIAKLTKRYPDGYSNQAAKERADKVSGNVA